MVVPVNCNHILGLFPYFSCNSNVSMVFVFEFSVLTVHEHGVVTDSSRRQLVRHSTEEDRNGGALSRCSVWIVIAGESR